MGFASANGGNVRNIIVHNIIWSNQMAESLIYRSHATFEVTCFPAFVGTLNVISSVLSVTDLLFLWVVDGGLGMQHGFLGVPEQLCDVL